METKALLQKLTQYYHLQHPDLIDPQITLDWVNTKGWESEIYAFSLTSGLKDRRKSVRRVVRLLTGGSDTQAETCHFKEPLRKRL